MFIIGAGSFFVFVLLVTETCFSFNSYFRKYLFKPLQNRFVFCTKNKNVCTNFQKTSGRFSAFVGMSFKNVTSVRWVTYGSSDSLNSVE